MPNPNPAVPEIHHDLFNPPRKHKLRIIVEGYVGTGKTTIARVIYDLLRGAGVPTTLEDGDDSAARRRPPTGITLSRLGAGEFYENVEIAVRNTGQGMDPRFRPGDVIIDPADGKKVTVTHVSTGDGKGWAYLWHDCGEGDGKAYGGGDINGYRLAAPE